MSKLNPREKNLRKIKVEPSTTTTLALEACGDTYWAYGNRTVGVADAVIQLPNYDVNESSFWVDVFSGDGTSPVLVKGMAAGVPGGPDFYRDGTSIGAKEYRVRNALVRFTINEEGYWDVIVLDDQSMKNDLNGNFDRTAIIVQDASDTVGTVIQGSIDMESQLSGMAYAPGTLIYVDIMAIATLTGATSGIKAFSGEALFVSTQNAGWRVVGGTLSENVALASGASASIDGVLGYSKNTGPLGTDKYLNFHVTAGATGADVLWTIKAIGIKTFGAIAAT